MEKSNSTESNELMLATKFWDWAKDFGVARVAVEMTKLGPDFAVTHSAVYQHLRGDTEPRGAKMRGYVKLSNGALTLQDLHDHVEKARAARAERELDRAFAATRAGA